MNHTSTNLSSDQMECLIYYDLVESVALSNQET